MDTRNAGFTIVELLIVIVVIAVLATISAVTFRGIQGRADDSAVKSDLTQAMKQIDIYRLRQGDYPDPTPVIMDPLGIKATKGSYNTSIGNFAYCRTVVAGADVVVVGGATKRGKMWYIDSRTGNTHKEYTGPASLSVDMADVCSLIMGVPSASISALRGYAPDSGGWQPWVK